MHSGSCNLLYALFIFKQVQVYRIPVVCRCCMFIFIVIVVRYFSLLAILTAREITSASAECHTLAYIVLTCRKTPVNQFIVVLITSSHFALFYVAFSRHVLRFTVTSPLGYQLHLCSATHFVFGDEEKVIAECVKVRRVYFFVLFRSLEPRS